MISLDQRQIGEGWVQVPVGDPVKTLDQYYRYATGKWALGYFFTSDRQKANDKVPYRRPVTLRAQLSVWPSLPGKVWRSRILPLFARPQ